MRKLKRIVLKNVFRMTNSEMAAITGCESGPMNYISLTCPTGTLRAGETITAYGDGACTSGSDWVRCEMGTTAPTQGQYVSCGNYDTHIWGIHLK